LRRVLDQTAATSPRIPGMLLRVEAPRLGLSWSGAAGLADRADRATRRRLAPGAAVRVASVTKTFTAAVVLRLVERGRLALDAPIARYLPATYTMLLAHGGYRPDRITARQLLQQTSGLFDYAETDAYDAAVRAGPAHRWSRLEQVRFALTHGRPYGPPGAAYHYSDTGYILLGAIIERVSGRPLAAPLRPARSRPHVPGNARTGAARRAAARSPILRGPGPRARRRLVRPLRRGRPGLDYGRPSSLSERSGLSIPRAVVQ